MLVVVVVVAGVGRSRGRGRGQVVGAEGKRARRVRSDWSGERGGGVLVGVIGRGRRRRRRRGRGMCRGVGRGRGLGAGAGVFRRIGWIRLRLHNLRDKIMYTFSLSFRSLLYASLLLDVHSASSTTSRLVYTVSAFTGNVFVGLGVYVSCKHSDVYSN